MPLSQEMVENPLDGAVRIGKSDWLKFFQNHKKACLSLSSTPLVMKFLERKEKERTDSPEAECSQYLMGMLVMQDVQLGTVTFYLFPQEAQFKFHFRLDNGPFAFFRGRIRRRIFKRRFLQFCKNHLPNLL
jgi:hypothetical protein